MSKDNVQTAELAVTLQDGTTKRLGDFWKERPLVLVFLRHFG
jgi:hypothetical protein